MGELETVEDLINRGDDEKVMLFRRHQLDAFQMVAIVVSIFKSFRSCVFIKVL